MQIPLGGERIGSGNKMNIRLRHYERSTHNLSQRFRSSLGIGILYPCLCLPVLRGDKLDINLAAGVRTLPSKGAMFGSYKLQVDYYQCPVRLYTGILHNNPYKLGLNMNMVYFPQMTLSAISKTLGSQTLPFSSSSLVRYLGLSGLGNVKTSATQKYYRNFNAIPVLAYYDIFKNYYSNKQENVAYVLSKLTTMENIGFKKAEIESGELDIRTESNRQIFNVPFQFGVGQVLEIYGEGLTINNIKYQAFLKGEPIAGNNGSIKNGEDNGDFIIENPSPNYMKIHVNGVDGNVDMYQFYIDTQSAPFEPSGLNLLSFPLDNIDEMRANLLSWHKMGAPYMINDYGKLPYKTVAEKANEKPQNGNVLNGLMIKTYQSDMFNNWLNTEYIDGINGIAQITRVSTEGGGFTIDALNFNEKMYNLLNRIMVSGATYDDWQNVVYEESPKKHLESPMYLGGLSQEIIFEEIVSTAITEHGTLGTMGGRGVSKHRKGGHIRVKIDEASFIIGIVSITPRVDYSQGNEFYMTDVFTMDDFHKPALDGIGFQDLIGERMAYFDTQINSTKVDDITRHVIGKLPAWIDYMTAVDKVYGDMSDGDNSFMVLNRKYEYDDELRCIKDATTYIEPNKYNEVFQYAARDSQNFLVQIEQNIIARRKMSAKQIPNI